MMNWQKTLLLKDKAIRQEVANLFGRKYCAQLVRAARALDRIARTLHG